MSVIREAPQAPVALPAHTGAAARRKRPVPEIVPAVRKAVRDMVHQAMELEDAARLHGIKPDRLAIALDKPSVQALLRREADVLRASARPGAIHRIIALGKSAASEAVKLKANTFLAVDPAERGGAPVQVNVNVAQPPGYVLAVDPRYAHAIAGPQPDGLRPSGHKPLIEHDATSPSSSVPDRSRGGRGG